MPEEAVNFWDAVKLVRYHALSSLSHDQLPPPLREAHLFARVMQEIPLSVSPGQRLAGDFGWQYASADHLREVESELAVRREEELARHPAESSPETLMRDWFHCFGGYTSAHTCVDYERVVRQGIAGVLQQV